MNRIFLKATMVCVSPIAVGNGKSEYTDSDVLVDSEGRPFIPGTTIAGVCRHYLEDQGENVGELFGSDKDEKSDSKIIFYEAFPKSKTVIGQRDGVEINLDTETANDGALFNYEIVGEDSKFDLRIEINDDENNNGKEYIKKIVNGFNNGFIRIGFKTNRGFGRVRLDKCKLAEITDINELINFSWDKVTEDFDVKDDSDNKYETHSYNLTLKSFLMISDNSTLEEKDGKFINAAQLENTSGKPVIPGTVWSGIFRHYCYKVLLEIYKDQDHSQEIAEKKTEEIFGNTENASKIIFDESVISGGAPMCITRNAIDRFTGGACDKKLFTNRPVFGGTTTLNVIIKNTLRSEMKNLALNLLELFIKEINDGFVNIGSMGSVGGGIFKVEGCES